MPMGLRAGRPTSGHRGSETHLSWRNVADWAKRKPVTLHLAGWADHDLAAAWLGHATVLFRVGGMTILADPVLSNRVGVGLGLVTGGPRRLVAPALSVRELPP